MILAHDKYKILLFAPAFAPFANPEAIVNNKLALAFKSAGWYVDVITRSDNELSDYNYGSMWEDCWLPLRPSTHPVTYEKVNRPARLVGTVMGALRTRYPGIGCRWASHSLKLALSMHREKRYDVIISRALPDFAHIPALLFAESTGLPWIANWNDPPLFLFPPPYNNRMSPFRRFINDRLVRAVINHATAITFPSDRLKAYVCENYGQTYAEKSFVIPHAALSWPNVAGPLGNILTLCHAGNLYAERDPSVFFRGLYHFLKRNQITRARFINIGMEAVNIKEKIVEEGLSDHVTLLGKQSYMETINYLSRCDILVAIENRYKGNIFLPSKISDYAQTGRPILSISPPDSSTHDIIKQHGGGIAVDCRSSEAIVDALLELYSHWEGTTLNEKYGSHRLYYLFSPERIIASYENIFSKIGLAS